MTVELLVGPPGTGKTHALLEVVDEELRRGTSPDRIALVTFTRRAAEEAATRACAQFSLTRTDLPWFRTLHSLCYRALGLRTSEVLERSSLRDFSVFAGIAVTGRYTEDGSMQGYTPGDRMLHMEHLSRVTGRPLRAVYDDDDDGLDWVEVDRAARYLGAFKASMRLADYTDMLTMFCDQRVRLKLEVLLVDEVQDQSHAQWCVVDRLAETCRRVVYAGDDDQAIYRWAGADVDRLVGYAGQTRVLDRSVRVPRVVQRLADGVIGRVSVRRPKEWAPREAEGVVDRVREFADVDAETGEVLVLARNTFVLTEQVVPELRRRGIYYAWGERGAVDPQVMSAILVWERLRRGEPVTAAEAREAYAYMSAGRGYVRGHRELPRLGPDERVDLDLLERQGGLLTRDIWHVALDRLPPDEREFVLAARRRGEKVTGVPRVRLSTIHGAKGGQADHVVIVNQLARRTHREMQRWPDDEHRVFYVAATRAKERLTIVEPQSQFYYDI